MADPLTKEDISVREYLRAIFNDDLRKQVALQRPIQTAEEVQTTLKHFSKANHSIVMTVDATDDICEVHRVNANKAKADKKAGKDHSAHQIDSNKAIVAKLDALCTLIEEMSKKTQNADWRESRFNKRWNSASNSCNHRESPEDFNKESTGMIYRRRVFHPTRCFSCGQEGHISRHCPNMQGKEEPQGARGGARRQ